MHVASLLIIECQYQYQHSDHGFRNQTEPPNLEHSEAYRRQTEIILPSESKHQTRERERDVERGGEGKRRPLPEDWQWPIEVASAAPCCPIGLGLIEKNRERGGARYQRVEKASKRALESRVEGLHGSMLPNRGMASKRMLENLRGLPWPPRGAKGSRKDATAEQEREAPVLHIFFKK